MKHNIISLFGISIMSLLIISTSCNRCSQKAKHTDDTATTEDPVIQDVSYNQQITDIAMFIAGLQVDTSSELFELSQTTQWQQFKQRMDEKWDMFYNDVDSNITPWIEKEMRLVNQQYNTLFYPFSGPDFINADVFFPDMEEYIFFGLEPPGSLPNPLSVPETELNDYFKMYEQSIYHIIYLSFFRTHSMKVDLSSREVDGAAPVLLIFMARAGKKIISIKPFKFGDNGSLEYDSLFNNFAPNQKFQKGVEILFRNENDPKVQKLVYFSIDISDGYLSRNENVVAYLEGIDPNCAVYIKSASYLLHDPFFETIKQLILDKGNFILQDDSGMPYKYFNKDEWQVNIYGEYERPIPIFSRYFQQDMLDEYKKQQPEPLKFRRGYAKKSNLQIAVKKIAT